MTILALMVTIQITRLLYSQQKNAGSDVKTVSRRQVFAKNLVRLKMLHQTIILTWHCLA